METLEKKFQPKDVIALFVLLLLGIFKLTGHDGQLDLPIALIIGYYFARREDTPIMVHKEEIMNPK